MGIFSDMRLRRLEPDVCTYSAAISACRKSARWQEAMGMFSNMRLCLLVPDGFTYSAAISVCENGVRWHEVSAFGWSLTPAEMACANCLADSRLHQKNWAL